VPPREFDCTQNLQCKTLEAWFELENARAQRHDRVSRHGRLGAESRGVNYDALMARTKLSDIGPGYVGGVPSFSKIVLKPAQLAAKALDAVGLLPEKRKQKMMQLGLGPDRFEPR
jgi:hypothetical protein